MGAVKWYRDPCVRMYTRWWFLLVLHGISEFITLHSTLFKYDLLLLLVSYWSKWDLKQNSIYIQIVLIDVWKWTYSCFYYFPVTFLFVWTCVFAGWHPITLITSAQTLTLRSREYSILKVAPLSASYCMWVSVRKWQLCLRDTVFSLR